MKLILSSLVGAFCSSLLLSTPGSHASLTTATAGGGLRPHKQQENNTTTASVFAHGDGHALRPQHQKERSLYHYSIGYALFDQYFYDIIEAVTLEYYQEIHTETVQFSQSCSSDNAMIKYMFMRFKGRQLALKNGAYTDVIPSSNVETYYEDYYTVSFLGTWVVSAAYFQDVLIRIRARLRDAGNVCGEDPQNTRGYFYLHDLTEYFVFYAAGVYDYYTYEVSPTTIDLAGAVLSPNSVSADIDFPFSPHDVASRFLEIWGGSTSEASLADGDALTDTINGAIDGELGPSAINAAGLYNLN